MHAGAAPLLLGVCMQVCLQVLQSFCFAYACKHMNACVCLAHSGLQLLSMLLVDVAQAGFMRLPLLPQCIFHPVADVIPQGLQITLQQQHCGSVS